ncbi:MAG: hypothetical protein U0105_03075 [Candidatus Obscuribacterales bacterium]
MAKGRASGPKRNPGSDGGSSDFGPDRDPRVPAPPKSLTDTAGYKKGKTKLSEAWLTYKRILREAFIRMNRTEQESLITKASVIITIGVTTLALVVFYPLVPQLVRVFLVPGAIFGAWWLGGKVVSQVVIARLEPMLNKPDYYV